MSVYAYHLDESPQIWISTSHHNNCSWFKDAYIVQTPSVFIGGLRFLKEGGGGGGVGGSNNAIMLITQQVFHLQYSHFN